MTGFATADSVDMTIYDRDESGTIDAVERITLDIDIENSRVTPAESYVIDSYTTDGTLILNDEFQAAFLNPEAYPRGITSPVTVVDSEPIVEPAQVSTPELIPEPEQTPLVPAAEDTKRDMTLLYVIGFMVILAVVIYLYTNRNKSE